MFIAGRWLDHAFAGSSSSWNTCRSSWCSPRTPWRRRPPSRLLSKVSDFFLAPRFMNCRCATTRYVYSDPRNGLTANRRVTNQPVYARMARSCIFIWETFHIRSRERKREKKNGLISKFLSTKTKKPAFPCITILRKLKTCRAFP